MMSVDLGKENANTLIPKAKEIMEQVLKDFEVSHSIDDDKHTKNLITLTKQAIIAIEEVRNFQV